MEHRARLVKMSRQYFINHCLDTFPYPNYQFEIAEIQVKSIVPLCKHVYEPRLTFAKHLIELYSISSIDLFEPCEYYNSIGEKRVIAPPVIEQRNGINVLCDGMHRIYSIIDNHEMNINVLIASNYELPLPGELNIWDNVKLVPKQLPAECNFINFRKEGLTRYSRFFNGNIQNKPHQFGGDL